MKTSHSVVLPKENKVERMKRIILEACKQSKRANLPKIRSLTDFNEIIKEKYENKIILDIEGKPLKDLVKNENQTSKKTIVLIGPEGGLTDEEIKSAEKAGFVKASVGKNVLRIETAAIAAAAIVGSSAY
jgi:16S rRNA (uracil1498-N3)-methyltransferase